MVMVAADHMSARATVMDVKDSGTDAPKTIAVVRVATRISVLQSAAKPAEDGVTVTTPTRYYASVKLT